MEDHILDLTKRQWFVSRHGLTVIGTWVRLDGRWRPCMAIVRNAARQLRPCVIPLESAWHWSDVIGNPQVHAAHLLGQLGVDPGNEANRNKLISLVNSRMHDLVTMPPRPPDAEEHAETVAEVTIHDDVNGTTEVSL